VIRNLSHVTPLSMAVYGSALLGAALALLNRITRR
jgi:hypothetical protein